MRPDRRRRHHGPMPEGAYEVLGRRDEALAGLIARHGTLNPFVWRELDDAVGGDPFAELVLHIVAQQISTGAR
jgi:hypothetical protein